MRCHLVLILGVEISFKLGWFNLLCENLVLAAGSCL
jgi:hypothetical protein